MSNLSEHTVLFCSQLWLQLGERIFLQVLCGVLRFHSAIANITHLEAVADLGLTDGGGGFLGSLGGLDPPGRWAVRESSPGNF